MTASYAHKYIAKASQYIILENQRNVLVFKHHKLVGRDKKPNSKKKLPLLERYTLSWTHTYIYKHTYTYTHKHVRTHKNTKSALDTHIST